MSDREAFRGYDEETDLARDLSLFDITMIGVGAMIGAGIFVLSGLAAGQAGPALVMAFAFNGFITIFTGMVYAELGSAIPEAGGGYLWVREALGRSQAFLAGWMSWFAHAVAGSLYILGFGAFADLLLEVYFGIPLFEPVTVGFVQFGPVKAFAVFAGVVFTYINYRGAKETGLAGNIVTLLKTSVIIVFVILGLGTMFGDPTGSTAKFEPFTPRGLGGVFIAMGLTFIAFEGYEIIVQSGEEVVNPRENVPKAVFYSMAIVVTIYMLVAVVLIGAVDVTPQLFQLAHEGSTAEHGPNLPALPGSAEDAAIWEILGYLGELGLARAADQVLPYGTLIILVAGIFSTLSALNATTFSSTRVSFAMGRDHVLPDMFESVHPETHTPWIAAIFSGGLIIFMAVTLPIESVAAATDVMFLLLFLQVNYAAIVIRREWGDEIEYGYLMPFFPYVPIIGILTKLFLAVYLFEYSPLAWYGAIAWILVGVGIFFVYSQGRIRETEIEAETRIVAETRTPEERSYQVLVPITNPETAKPLIAIAGAIARHHDGELLVTTVATVPDQTPLSEGRQFVDGQEERLDEAMAYVPDDVPAHQTVTIGHEIGQSITNLAYQRDSDLVVMGWRGRRKRRSDLVLGSTIDYVVENAPCDVSVVKSDSIGETGKILVPTVGGAHADRSEEIAASLTETNGHPITLLTVATQDREDAESFLEDRVAAFAEEDIDVASVVIESDDIASAIVEYATENEFETIIIGAAEEGILQRVLFGEIPESVGEQFAGQVVMVKKYRPVRSFIGMWLRKWIGSPSPDHDQE